MKKDEFDEWVAALRSGEYKQGKSRLIQKSWDDTFQYCCLGVKCELDAKAERHQVTKKLHGFIFELLRLWGMTSIQAGILARMNDREFESFDQIANYLVKHESEFVHDA